MLLTHKSLLVLLRIMAGSSAADPLLSSLWLDLCEEPAAQDRVAPVAPHVEVR